MNDRFEDAWESLDDVERSLLLEERDTRSVSPPVAAILLRLALAIEPQPALFPAPAHWPIGFREFLDDKAALVTVEDDQECE